MLWTREYKLSTVHVDDVVRAIWHLCYHGKVGDVYNLADHGNTSQSHVPRYVERIRIDR